MKKKLKYYVKTLTFLKKLQKIIKKMKKLDIAQI